MNDRAKWWSVAALILVWAAVLVVRLADQPTPQRVPLTYRSGQTLPKESVRSGLGVPTVVQPVRVPAGPVPFTTPKNIFAPLESNGDESDKAKRARTLQAKKAPHSSATVPAQAPAPPPPSAEELAARQAQLAAQQTQQAIAQYRFLGYLTQAGESRAFLGKGQQIYIVKAGDMLDERLRVQMITAAAVQLKDAGTSVEGTIPISQTDGRGF